MCIARGALLACLVFTSSAWSADGLGLTPTPDTLPWARWQARISLSSAAPVWRAGLGGYPTAGLRPASVSVMGDYYFTDPLLGGSGGFRATSGVIVGLRTQGQVAPASGTVGTVGSDLAADSAASPYIGVGYTGLSSRGAWHYSADLGLSAQSLGTGAIRFGRPVGASSDDLSRDLRLGPTLQFGVSYSF